MYLSPCFFVHIIQKAESALAITEEVELLRTNHINGWEPCTFCANSEPIPERLYVQAGSSDKIKRWNPRI